MGLFGGIAEKLLGGSIARDLRHSMENFLDRSPITRGHCLSSRSDMSA
jgi:hypothetical protein